MMKYIVLIKKSGGTIVINNDGKGFTFNDAREQARIWRKRGEAAEVVNMRGVKNYAD